MKKEKELDYLFITWGKPFNHSSGAVNKQIDFLSNSLAADGWNVGILYMSYASVSSFYGFSRKNSVKLFLKIEIAKVLYSKIFSKVYLKIRKRSSNTYLNPKINIFISNYKLPNVHIKRLVTSYWWGILVPDQTKNVENFYFLLYHDYSVDIKNSNVKNLKYLETAYKISNKISANPLLNKKFGINIPLITEGISLDEYKCTTTFDNKNTNTILVPLRSNAVKGAEYAIEALRLINKEYPNLSIVGFGDYSNPLPNFIGFHYNISQRELKQLYCKAGFFLLPSLEEGISEPLIEAMIAGCIPISTRCGGPETVITHGRDGFLVPSRDPVGIFTQFNKLMNKDIDLKKISESAIETAMKYDIRKTYEDFIKAIDFYENRK